jgi:hypothetical protein
MGADGALSELMIGVAISGRAIDLFNARIASAVMFRSALTASGALSLSRVRHSSGRLLYSPLYRPNWFSRVGKTRIRFAIARNHQR